MYGKVKSWNKLVEEFDVFEGYIKHPYGDRNVTLRLNAENYKNLNSNRIVQITNSWNEDKEYEVYYQAFSYLHKCYFEKTATTRAELEDSKTDIWVTDELLYKLNNYDLVKQKGTIKYKMTEHYDTGFKIKKVNGTGILYISNKQKFLDEWKFIPKEKEPKTDEKIKQTPKENNMAKLKDTALNLVKTNKNNGLAVARVTAGKAINKQAIKLIKPELPMVVRSFADHPIAPMIFANIIAMAIKSYTNNPKAISAADMMLEAAAFQAADAFKIDDMIEDLLDGITLPGVSDETIDIATAKIADLRKFAEENDIDLSGISGINNIRSTISNTIENH